MRTAGYLFSMFNKKFTLQVTPRVRYSGFLEQVFSVLQSRPVIHPLALPTVYLRLWA